MSFKGRVISMRMVMAPPCSWLPGGADSSPSILMQRFSALIKGNVSSVRTFTHGLTGLGSAIDQLLAMKILHFARLYNYMS